MIRYADTWLLTASPRLQEWVRANVDPDEVRAFAFRGWPGPGLARLDVCTPPPPGPVVLNRLYWPTGASRFSFVHAAASQAQLDRIRRYVYPSAAEYRPAPFEMHARAGSRMTTRLYLLPARPLQAIGAKNLYLLTLVDERYFWWERAAAVDVAGGTTTWEQLYASIAAALGITLAVDAIPETYLKPPAGLATSYESLPPLLDSVARCVGQRVVRQVDGTVRAWNVRESRAAVAAQLRNLPTKQAGGLFALEAT